MVIKVIPVGMLMTNCYVVMDEETKEAVIIDPGARENRILDVVADLGATVKYIAITHGHFDHILVAHKILEATKAKLMIHKDDVKLLTKEMVTKSGKYTTAAYEEVTPDVILDDGDSFNVGGLEFTVLSTPGHSNGSVCYICENVIFSGDTLFKGSCGRCDLIDGDFEKMFVSLKKLAQLEGDFRVFPGHESATTMDYERKNNEYMLEAMKK